MGAGLGAWLAGGWLVLAGHDVGNEDARQVTRCETLRVLCEYAQEPDHGVWLDTVAAVAAHVRGWKRKNSLEGGMEHVGKEDGAARLYPG